MATYNNLNYCGWKSNLTSRKMTAGKGKAGFVLSVLVALVIVMFVSRILALIDERIQSRNVSGLTFLSEMLSIPAAEAATVKPGLFFQTDGDRGYWYVNPATGNRSYITSDSDFARLTSIVAKNLSASEFKKYQKKGPAALRGRMAVYNGNLYYFGGNSLANYPLGPTGGAFNFIKTVSFNAPDTSLMKFRIAKGFEKIPVAASAQNPVTTASTINATKPGPASSADFKNGLDIKEYCKKNNYKIAAAGSALDTECKKLEDAYLKKVAYFDKLNNPQLNTQNSNPLTTIPAPSPSPTSTPTPTTNPTTPVSTPIVQTSNGPIIRVGVFSSPAEQRVRASKTFDLKNSSGAILLSVQPNQILTIDYLEAQGQYAYGISGATNTTPSYLHMTANDDSTIFEVVSFENRPAWNTSLNDNLYLGELELRYNSSKNRTWLINELPLETYLKGMAETSNISPPEYLKTMAVAARTYGMYHLARGTKHGDEYFTVDATYDQVYRGYGTQLRMPNLVSAVDATKGMIVTYAGDIAITPYFSWSDGHTRSMLEVWGTDKPWLQSVTEPAGYTKTTLYGHGVGLSAYGAILLASDQYSYTYDQILKYYYKGVDVTPNYNGLAGTVVARR